MDPSEAPSTVGLLPTTDMTGAELTVNGISTVSDKQLVTELRVLTKKLPSALGAVVGE